MNKAARKTLLTIGGPAVGIALWIWSAVWSTNVCVQYCLYFWLAPFELFFVVGVVGLIIALVAQTYRAFDAQEHPKKYFNNTYPDRRPTFWTREPNPKYEEPKTIEGE